VQGCIWWFWYCDGCVCGAYRCGLLPRDFNQPNTTPTKTQALTIHFNQSLTHSPIYPFDISNITVLVAAPAVFRHPLLGDFPPSPFAESFVPPPFESDLRGQVSCVCVCVVCVVCALFVLSLFVEEEEEEEEEGATGGLGWVG
jgi:hypothetical protein